MSKKSELKAEIDQLERQKELRLQDLARATQGHIRCFSAADWLLDMVTGKWTAADDCKLCLTNDEGQKKCSTMCAGLRIEYAQKALEENPL